jgi:hypothetical protein
LYSSYFGLGYGKGAPHMGQFSASPSGVVLRGTDERVPQYAHAAVTVSASPFLLSLTIFPRINDLIIIKQILLLFVNK